MMAFHRRELLISDKNPKFSKKNAEDCYLCYVCPENCYLSPPPPSPPPPPPPPPQFSDSSKNHIPTVLILMLCVLGVAFLVLSYLTVSRYRHRNSRSGNQGDSETSRTNFIDENHGPILDHPIWYIRTVGLPQSVIDSIASFTYKKGFGLIDCSVCLNDFKEDEIIRLLPKCSHAFHLDCIDTWLRSHKNCPVCRAPVLAVDARVSPVESSSSSSESIGVSPVSNEPETRVDDPVKREEFDDDDDDDDRISKDQLARMEMLRVLSDLVERRVELDLQPLMRRSVSMDFSDYKRNSSIYRLLQKGKGPLPVSMKRSFSFKNTSTRESVITIIGD